MPKPVHKPSEHKPLLAKPSLATTGLKITTPRVKILALFQGTDGRTDQERHLSAEDVYRALLTSGEDIGLATVYRVLAQFEQAGILMRHHFGTGDKAVYELVDNQHHDHLVCLDCARVEEFVDKEIEKRQNDVATKMGFQLADHALSLYGHCVKKNCPSKPLGV